MTDGCNEINEEASTSEDDSLSLLCNLDACQSKEAPDDLELGDFDSQVGNEEQQKEVKTNEVKPPESWTSTCTQPEAGCPNSSSQLAVEVMQRVKIPSKARLHKRSAMGETLLHKACRRDDLAQVRVLIKAGISINTEDYAGWTALHEASAVGETAVVEELLRAGANVNARSFDGTTPLHDAVMAGHYQVVKLLCQYGSNVRDRNLGGLSALDMVMEENIKELLLACVMHEQALAQYRQAGGTSSEAHCHMQLPCQRSISHSHNDMAKVQSRESGDKDEAAKSGDIQPRRIDTTTDNRTHSEVVTVLLEEVRRRQTEILAWPLAGLEDADRYHAALTHTHSVLMEVFAKQNLEKDNVAQKYGSAPNCLRQRLLRSQIISLASCQRTLVEVLQNQMHLVEIYETMTAKLSTQHSNSQSDTVVTQQPYHLTTTASAVISSKAGEAHSCSQDRQKKKSHGPVRRASLFGSAPPNNAEGPKVPRPPAPQLPQVKKTLTLADVLNEKASRCQSPAPHPGNTSQQINFKIKASNALIQTSPEDNSRHLSKLIQRGVMPPGSTLQLLWKGHRHFARVQGDGSLKDSKGKLHQFPEHWLESIIGKNIPVSSAYAWDKVTFRDKPLSYYLLNAEAAGNRPRTCLEDDVQHCRARLSQEELLTEAAVVKRLMNIKIIHLVNDEELMPVAVLDHHWEKLLNKDSLQSQDW